MTPSHKNTASRKSVSTRPRGYIDDYNPQEKTKRLLCDVQAVLEEYEAYWPLTCRQVYYRLIGAYGYPKTEEFYERVCNHMSNARRGRVIPFSAIRDDGVSTFGLDHFDDEEHFLRHVRELGEGYKRNKLAGQELHIEVWCEAAGMMPQLFSVAEPYSINVYSSGGFDSLTAKKRLADRICAIGKRTIILHLGDYDPSGQSIFDSVAADVAAFVERDRPWATVSVEFIRVALTADQVRKHNLPTAPAKATDSRSKSWEGGTCQLEALAPDVIASILAEAIVAHIDIIRLLNDRALESIDKRKIAGALPAPRGDA
ncbi:hypothetical protein [Ferirhizobium litorale]|uniref:DUF2399 domain-containing protein n=1 Tax=Ferirhizobium litorale TaxID=2927786 RepID=A0AAE3U355_9HYPH|nr:hypothetical protein [Fererhizobium litorale]MDI7921749.1 hypothetical protein [Fererhizobium litorale]